jgi:hypothetical protein
MLPVWFWIAAVLSVSATTGWQEAADNFSRDIGSTGATILDRREELFLPRALQHELSPKSNWPSRANKDYVY